MRIHPTPIQQLPHHLPLGQHYYLVFGVSFQRLLCLYKHIHIHTITRNSNIPTTTIDIIVYASISHCSGTCVRQAPKSWITQLKGTNVPVLIIMDKLLFTEVVPTYTPTSNVRVPISHILTNTVSYQAFNLYQYDRWKNGLHCSQFIL